MSSVKLPSTAIIDDQHVWNQVLTGASPGRPALFLDRDGAMIIEENYLSAPEKVVLINGTAETIRTANAKNIPVVVITNQSGIARGYFDWQAFAAVQQRLLDLLAAEGAKVDAVYASPYHKNGAPPYQHPSHPSRKPNPGMLENAKRDLGVDLFQSWVVGDKAGDIGAGLNAGLSGGLHVLTGHGRDEGEAEKALALAKENFVVEQAESIAAAHKIIPLLKS